VKRVFPLLVERLKERKPSLVEYVQKVLDIFVDEAVEDLEEISPGLLLSIFPPNKLLTTVKIRYPSSSQWKKSKVETNFVFLVA